MSLKVAKMSTCVKGRPYLRRYNYNSKRGLPEEAAWRTQYRLVVEANIAYIYHPPTSYDAKNIPVSGRDRSNWCLYPGPMFARHMLQKYRSQEQHPVARFLKDKGKKYYDIADESNVKPIQIRRY
jgi:hypothetical protein